MAGGDILIIASPGTGRFREKTSTEPEEHPPFSARHIRATQAGVLLTPVLYHYA
jgi:hypothetical protein